MPGIEFGVKMQVLMACFCFCFFFEKHKIVTMKDFFCLFVLRFGFTNSKLVKKLLGIRYEQNIVVRI